jgi:hypothetical protein
MLDRLCIFPVKGEPSDGGNNDMTLRDYFAAKAMQSLVITHTESGIPIIASMAYLMADKMMEVRDDTNS